MITMIAAMLLANGGMPVTRTIYFYVTGEAKAEPDMATVSFTVSSTANSAKDAYNAVEKKVGKIGKDLGKVGVKDVIVTSLYVSPQYSYDGYEVLGYNVTEYLTADVPSIKDLDRVTGTLSGDKEVVLSGVSYGISKPDKAIADALKDASGKIGSRMEKMKSLTGATDVWPYSISVSASVPGSYNYYYGYGYGQANQVLVTVYATYQMTMPGDKPVPDSLQIMPTLTVSSYADVPTEAMTAVASLSITATKPTAAEAYAEADKILGELKKKLGKDGETSITYSYTSPEYGADGYKILAYTVTQTVEVRSTSMDKTGKLMDAATTIEGVTLTSMYYENKSSEKEENQAREEAFGKAKAQAEEFARLLGVKLGPATYISESVTAPYAGGYGGGEYDYMDGGGGYASSGSLNTTVSLSVSFEIKKK